MFPPDQHVGRRIRGKRRAMAVEQDELAQLLGVDRDVIEAYENGATRVPPEQLARLAEYFGVPIGYFLPGGRSVP